MPTGASNTRNTQNISHNTKNNLCFYVCPLDSLVCVYEPLGAATEGAVRTPPPILCLSVVQLALPRAGYE